LCIHALGNLLSFACAWHGLILFPISHTRTTSMLAT
jgi:hypothetical protein